MTFLWMSIWGIQYLFMLDEGNIIRGEHLAWESRRRSAVAFELVDRCKYRGALEVFMLSMPSALQPVARPPVCARLWPPQPWRHGRSGLVGLGPCRPHRWAVWIDSLTATVCRMEYVQTS